MPDCNMRLEAPRLKSIEVRLADSHAIRSHLIRTHVDLARGRGDYTVTIRAGDVSRQSNLHHGTA